MISVAGIRGVVGTSLTSDLALKYAAAFGTFIGKGSAIVGRDSRISGPVIEQAVEVGLRSVGCNVIKIGIVPTPTVQLMTKLLKAKGGIAITASHNPPQWNALKLISGEGLFLNQEQGKKVISIFENNAFAFKKFDGLGTCQRYPLAIQEHVEKILGLPYIDINSIKKRAFKVVIDTCHGAGGPIFQLLLENLGCQVISLHHDTNGKFSRPIEPMAKNLGELEKAVLKYRADIGFATDADVDRLSIVTDKGKAAGEEYSLVLVARYMFSHFQTNAVTNLSTSRMIDDIASEYGAKVIRTAVGEANVVMGMKKSHALIGGEGNGGIIIPKLNYGRDASAGIALILQLLSRETQPISTIIDRLPKYHMIKATLNIKDPKKYLQKTEKIFTGCRKDKLDGIKYIWPDGWLHVRSSGTEPIVRIIAESKKQSAVKALVKKANISA
jgi:phosphomannomutase